MQSVEQLRDRLAELMGWEKITIDGWVRGKGLRATIQGHPVTISLDWLAAHGLPDRVTLFLLTRRTGGTFECELDTDGDDPCFYGMGDSPMHALLAACVAAWEAQNERTKP